MMQTPVASAHPDPHDFSTLVERIVGTHRMLIERSVRAVNASLTLRNWAIGAYIFEYEQQGADRAEYGEQLFERLSKSLLALASVRYHPRELRRCRTFYLAYPEIRGTLPPESLSLLQPVTLEGMTVLNGQNPIREAVSPEFGIPPERLILSLSFSHFVELVSIDDPVKRRFYEVECVAGNWSVRELKRQIASLYYERSGLSSDKVKLSGFVQKKAESSSVALNIRDPYVFEFLGLKAQDVMYESEVENAILDNLEEFLMELGHGFCFEARQKCIRIGDEFFFVDLVFYHRLLKCHVLVELKLSAFNHEHIGQLNTYVSWYKKNMMAEGDNHPIGILLCTQKNHSLVEFALAGMDNQLFVSKYQLELPKREEMERFIEDRMREVSSE